MTEDQPRWRRRKGARPAEIVEAALDVFAERGFAAAKLDEIARRAGVSKAALYLYFDTKEALFHAAAESLAGPQLTAVAALVANIEAPFAEVAPLVLARVAAILTDTRAPALATMVIGEARNFPDLAAIWRDDVVMKVLGMIAGLIEKAQGRGEVRAGDSKLLALSLMGPMVLGALFNTVLAGKDGARFDLVALARQHADVAIAGLAPDASA